MYILRYEADSGAILLVILLYEADFAPFLLLILLYEAGAFDSDADSGDSGADPASSNADIPRWGLAVYRSAGSIRPAPFRAQPC